MNDELTALLEQGQAELARQREEAEREREAKRQAAVDARTDRWAFFDNNMAEILPAALRDGQISPAYDPDEDPPSGRYAHVVLSLPGFCPFRVQLIKIEDRYLMREGEGDGTIYAVPDYWLDRSDYWEDDGPDWRVVPDYTTRRNPVYTNDLSLALAVAAERGEEKAKLEAEAASLNAELVASRQAVHDTVKAGTERRQMEREIEAARLVDALNDDPIALALTRLFLAVQRERNGWHDQLDAAAEYAEQVNDSASRKARELEEQIRRAGEQVSTYRYQAQEAEDKAARLERERCR